MAEDKSPALAAITKAKKPTSWQRRKAAKLGVPAAEVATGGKPTKPFSEARAAETALQEACAQAKAASAEARERHRLGRPAEPGDAELAERYSKVKAELNAAKVAAAAAAPAQKKRKKKADAPEKQGAAPASKPAAEPDLTAELEPEPEVAISKKKRQKLEAAAAAAASSDGEQWTCELCDTTILVRADGRAREQHLAGKAHAKRLRAREAAGAAGAGAAASLAMYVCKLCTCTLALAAGEAHESGAKHLERLEQMRSFFKHHSYDGLDETLKKGDWICCHGHAPQLVYAARATCCRAQCRATWEQGLAQGEATEMVARAPLPGQAQQRNPPPKKEKTEKRAARA